MFCLSILLKRKTGYFKAGFLKTKNKTKKPTTSTTLLQSLSLYIKTVF